MNKLVVVLVVLAPALAHADKVFQVGKGATWDCKSDPVVNINHGRGKYTFKGACKEVNLNGGENTVTVESADTLNINGGSNTVVVTEIDTINLVGAGNKVTWTKAKSGDKPSVNLIGTNNKVDRGGGAPPADKAAPPADKPAPSNAIDCAKQPAYTINNGSNTLAFVGTCDQIVVNGGDNRLTIENVKALTLNGSDNVIGVGGVDRISMNGGDNKVSYKKGLSGAKPKVTSTGENNTAAQVK